MWPEECWLSWSKKAPVFKGRIFISKEDIISCLKENVAEMEERYEAMQNHPDYKTGKNFAQYGLCQKFLVFDEWAPLLR